jgi:hypothetical protein
MHINLRLVRVPETAMKRRYAVLDGDTITVFKDRLVEAIEYWLAADQDGTVSIMAVPR